MKRQRVEEELIGYNLTDTRFIYASVKVIYRQFQETEMLPY